MVRRVAFLYRLFVLGAAVVQSCGEPVQPNSPPVITSYFPKEYLLEILSDIDSIPFSMRATDPEGDRVTYGFFMIGDDGEMTEQLCSGCEYIFSSRDEGFFHVQGRAHDRSDYSSKDWFVSVMESNPSGPAILSGRPEMDSISVAAGAEVEFVLLAEDDKPEDLLYSFLADGEVIRPFDSDPSVRYVFTGLGTFDFKGVAWDGEYGDTLTWVLHVVEESDTTPPAMIVDMAGFTGASKGTIRLRWTAPGDDGMEGKAYRYLLKTDASSILDETGWNRARVLEGAPLPGPAGTVEDLLLEGLEPGSRLYAAVRALDEFGNISPLGNCVSAIASEATVVDGYIFDAVSGDAISGAVIYGYGTICESTDEGYFSFILNDDTPGTLKIKDEEDPCSVGDYYDHVLISRELAGRPTLYIAMVPYYDLVSLLGDSYEGSFYVFFRAMTDTRGLLGMPTVFKNWDHYPVTVYSPPSTYMDTDLKGMADDRMDLWNTMTGKDLFVITPDSASADVEIVYELGVTEAKHHVEYVSYKEDGTPEKMRVVIYPDNQSPAIQIKGLMVFAHELGHILQLGHSTDRGHLMIGGTMPSTDHPSADEINLVRVLVGLPAIFDAARIEEQ